MTTATFSGTICGKPVAGSIVDQGYQATLDAYVCEPDQVWLLPKSGGYAVHIGVDNKAAIGFVGPIPEAEGCWRVHRLDLWDLQYRSAADAAYALIRRDMPEVVDHETGEVR